MYKSSAGAVLGTTLTLNSLGNPKDSGGTEVDIYYDDAVTYKIIRKDASGTQIDPVIDPWRVIDPSAGGTSSVQNSAATYGTNGGSTASVYAIDMDPTLTAYTAGQRFHFIAPLTNVADPDLNVDALGAKNILHPDGTTLAAGDIPANAMVDVFYDGTQFQLLSVANSASASGKGVVELSTDAEADTGTDTTRAITPANLAYVLDGTGGTNQVETAAIADNAVTNAKMADDAIDDAELKDDIAWRHIETVSWSSGNDIASTAAGIATHDELFIVCEGITASGGVSQDLNVQIATGGTPTFQTSSYQGDQSNGLLIETDFNDGDGYDCVVHITGCEAGQNPLMVEQGIHDDAAVYNSQRSGALYTGSTLQVSGVKIIRDTSDLSAGRIVVYGRMNA